MKIIHIFFSFALLLAPLFAQAQSVQESGRAQIAALAEEKAGRSPVQQKIDSQLLYAAKELRGEAIAGGKTTVAADIAYLADAQVLVDIRAEVTPALLAVIASTGGEVVNSFPAARAVRAKIFAQRAEEIAALAEVQTVRRAARARTNTITSQGDATHRGPAARATYFTRGAGVKVGVLSDSVDYLSGSLASGELASVTILPGQAGAGAGEGTAMLEIVHDLAPDAQLFFATAFNGEASFAQNILDLRAAGCDIIVDDVGYFSESPFQDDLISQAVNTVTAGGGLYFSSAGNSGNKNDGTSGTWEGDFVDGGAAAAPVAGKGGRLHRFGATNYDACIAGGGDRNVSLFWADPLGAATNDYDVYVLDSTGATVLRASNTTQNGTQDPWEYIDALNVGERIVVVKAAGAARFLHLDTGRARLAVSTNGNVRGHPAAVGAFGVAAVAAPTSFPSAFAGGAMNPVETFSSDGPRHVFYTANGAAITPDNFLASGGAVRQKPDLAAADGVSTSVPGFQPFYGTSAAAPHAAAIAALLKSYNPTLSTAQMRTALLAGCLEIEAAGIDPDSGAGLLMATNALQAAPAPLPAPHIAANGLTLVSETVVPFNNQIDPAEVVTVTLGLLNGGNLATTNLVATLLTADGVTEPSAAQNYGVLAAGGGTATRQFTFRANGPLGGTNKAKLQLADGATNLGVVEFTFPLATGTTTTTGYANAYAIAIPDSGPGSPYPSNITVAGSTGVVTKVTVTLTGFTHTYPGDTGALLVGPGGQKVLLYAGAGGGTAISGVNLTFDDAAATMLSSTAAMTTGSYKTSFYGSAPVFTTPAPGGPFDNAMSAFNGASANGVWKLFVSDFYAGDSGSLTSWNLSITTAIPGPAAAGTADIAVSLSAPATAVLGGTQAVVVTVRNYGPSACAGATASYPLPTGSSYVSSSSTQGTTAFSNGTLTANIGTLASGASAAVTIRSIINSGTVVVETASATSATVDADRTNNQASTNRIVGTVDLTPYVPDTWSDSIVVARAANVFTDATALTTADTLTLVWAVANLGDTASEAGLEVAIYLDGILNTTGTTTGGLNPLTYVFWNYATIGPLAPGNHTIRMVVDPAGAIAETDKSNNEHTKTINVAQTGAASAVDFIVAPTAGRADRYDNGGFDFTVSGLTSIGQSGTGTMTWSGGTFTLGSAGSYVGQKNGSIGALTIGSGAMSFTTLEVGSQTGAQGTLTLNGTAAASGFTSTIIGQSGVGVMNVNGGTFTTLQLVLGAGAGSTGSFAANGGTTSGSSLALGQSGTGSLTINGGAMNFSTITTGISAGIAFPQGSLSATSSTMALGAAGLIVGDGTHAATLTLGSGTHAITGGVHLKTASTLSLNVAQAGSTAFALEGGTLLGRGSIGALSATSGSVLDPGGTSVATLATGAVQLAAGVILKTDIAAAGCDLLDVAGTVALGGATFSPTLRMAPALGQTFLLVQNDGTDAVGATFAGLAEGALLSLTNVGVGGGTFTAQITYAGGTGNDVVLTFATAPTLAVSAATSVSSTSAMLNGAVNPNGLATTGQFQFGLTAAYGSTALAQNLGAGTSDVPTSATLSSLAPHTLYHYRLVAANSVGTTSSGDGTFTTLNTSPTAPDGFSTATTGDVKTITLPFPTTDADGDAVTLTSVTPGAHLTVGTTSGASVTFTPNADFAGTSTLAYTVSDGFSGTASGTITVTIADNDAPAIAIHADVVAEATSAAGAAVSYAAASATDAVGVSSISYSQNSGTVFPLGATTVTITAKDAANNTTAAIFTVTVQDTTAPLIAAHANVVAEATSAAGAVVTYTAANATDAVTTSPAITYSQGSGTVFPLGATTVTITAKDAANNTTTATFTVTVRDTTAPLIAAHANVVAEATSAAGAIVSYAAVSATDAVTANPSITYSQGSGTVFPLGITIVTISAKDAANNTSIATFTVTVHDTTAPVVAAHISLFAEAASAAGAIVNYTAASATDAVTASPVISYSQDTGTLFPLGTTSVIIAAEDAANNVGSATFTITVQDTTAPLIAAHASVITEATSAAGAVVSYTAATASDAVAASPAITYSQNSGTLFPLGATTVTITAKDAFTNTATATFTITVRDTTAPVLTIPLNQLAEATSPAGASVTYGTARATDIVTASPVISYSKNSGTTFPIAITGVLVTATDGAGRQTSGTFYVTVRDTTAPVLTVPADVSVGTPDPLGTVVTFPPATATDAATVSPGITYSQASGTHFPIGTSTVSVTAKDAANNTTTATFAVKVILTSVQTAALATAGAPVPGAGVDARIAAGAVWTSFGPPAVNDAAQIAFLGKWLAAKTTTAPAQKGAGIFLGTTLVAAATESVPGLNGAAFQSFRDPLIAPDGSVAFTATTASGTLLMSTAGGTLTVVARTGDSLASAGGAKWARFTGMWADTRGVAFTALLAAGTGVPKVKPSDDQVFCTWEPASGTRILLREGATIGLRRLARFTTFAPGLGSPGQGRGWAQADASGFRIGALGYFTDGTQSILRVDSTGTVETLCQSGASGPGLPTTGGIFKSYSFPAFASGMSAPAFLGTLVGGGKAIYQLDETTGTCDALAAVGAPVPAPTAAIFSTLGDPVLSQDGATVAFLAKIKDSGIPAATTSTLWWQLDSGTLALLARTGTQPAEVPTGARWKTFTTLAMSTSTSGRGRPLFIGTMLAGKGGVTAATDIAVWSVDTPGALRRAFREGDTIAGKTLKNFRVLKATVGTPGITRSVNNTQTIAWLATYTDGTTGIVQTQVP